MGNLNIDGKPEETEEELKEKETTLQLFQSMSQKEQRTL